MEIVHKMESVHKMGSNHNMESEYTQPFWCWLCWCFYFYFCCFGFLTTFGVEPFLVLTYFDCWLLFFNHFGFWSLASAEHFCSAQLSFTLLALKFVTWEICDMGNSWHGKFVTWENCHMGKVVKKLSKKSSNKTK